MKRPTSSRRPVPVMGGRDFDRSKNSSGHKFRPLKGLENQGLTISLYDVDFLACWHVVSKRQKLRFRSVKLGVPTESTP